MVAGLLLSAALCVSAEPAAPGMTESHRDALAQYGVAVWNLRRDRLLTAAKQLEAIAKQDPESTEPLKELTRLYAQLGRDVKAIECARKVLEKNPDDFDTAALLARLLFDAGELKEALAAAKLASESKALPQFADRAVRVSRDLAALCERAGELAVAEAALRKALELVTDKRAEAIKSAAFTPKEADKAAADCYERLGHILVKRAKFDDAAKAFDAAAKLYADNKKADDSLSAIRLDWNLSGAYLAKGEHALALKHLTEFLKLQPQAAEPYQRLAKILRGLNRDDEIVPALKLYAERDKLNRPLTAVLAAELCHDPATRRDGDKLFEAITSVTAEPAIIAVMVKSHFDTRRPEQIIADIDRAFVLFEDKKKEKHDFPTTLAGKALAAEKERALAAAKAFAADKVRAITDTLHNDATGVATLLRAAGEDLRAGTKRAHGTYYFLGSLAMKHNKLDLAAVQFRQAVRGAPKESLLDAYSSLIDVLWYAGKPAEVETVCRDGLDSRDVFIAPVFFNFHLARALAEQGKENAAIAAADKAILQAGDGDRLVVRLRKHLVLRILGKWDDAIEYGKKLLEEFDIPSERAKIRYVLASAYWGAKNTTEAETLLRANLDENPDDVGACNDLGYHLADQGRNLDEAERLVRHAIAIDRIERRKSGSVELDSAAYRDSLGWVLFRKGKHTEAKAELERALELAGGATDPVVWDHYGDVLFRLNDKPKAKFAWEKAKQLYEDDLRLSMRARRDGRLDEVKRKLTRVP